MNFTAQQQKRFADYQATIEDYGLEFTPIVFSTSASPKPLAAERVNAQQSSHKPPKYYSFLRPLSGMAPLTTVRATTAVVESNIPAMMLKTQNLTPMPLPKPIITKLIPPSLQFFDRFNGHTCTLLTGLPGKTKRLCPCVRRLYMDIVFIVLIVLFFALSWGLAELCDRI